MGLALGMLVMWLVEASGTQEAILASDWTAMGNNNSGVS